jgi:hypothetical protein
MAAMTAFCVDVSCVNSSVGDGPEAKYLISLYPEQGPEALRFLPNDDVLCETLERLGVHAPQQERILSVLRTLGRETVPVDISEEVAREFGWPPEK